jgi:hypothetical protein
VYKEGMNKNEAIEFVKNGNISITWADVSC